MRGGAGQDPDRSELSRLRLRDGQCVLYRGSRRDGRVSGGNDPRVSALEPARRFQSSLHRRSRNQGADARQGLRRRRQRSGRGRHVHARSREGRHDGSRFRLFAAHARMRRRHSDRRAIPWRRGRADARARSRRSESPHRRVAAGSLVGWRCCRASDRRVLRRRTHVVAHAGAAVPMHGR